MTELRSAIDALDRKLVDLLILRAAYIDRAIELKSPRGMPARIHDRVEEVVENVRRHAADQGLDSDLAETLWRTIIDWSIAREETILGPTPAGQGD